MNGKSLTSTSKWYTEPLKRIANYIALAAAAITAVLAILNQTGAVDFVPTKYRGTVTAIIGGLGTALVVLHKVQGYLGRNGVPGTNFNGMISPEHVHAAMVQSAVSAVPVATLDAPVVVAAPAHPYEPLGAALGTNIDGTPRVA